MKTIQRRTLEKYPIRQVQGVRTNWDGFWPAIGFSMHVEADFVLFRQNVNMTIVALKKDGASVTRSNENARHSLHC